MDYLSSIDTWVTAFLGAHATTKAIFSILATVFGYGRAKAWWDKRNGIQVK